MLQGQRSDPQVVGRGDPWIVTRGIYSIHFYLRVCGFLFHISYVELSDENTAQESIFMRGCDSSNHE
jgi:hypothetical protein